MKITISDFDKYLIKLPNLEQPSVGLKLNDYINIYQQETLDRFGVAFGDLMLSEYDQQPASQRSKNFFDGVVYKDLRYKGVKEAMTKEIAFRYLLDNPLYVSQVGVAVANVENSTLVNQGYYINKLRNDSVYILDCIYQYITANESLYPEFNKDKFNNLNRRGSYNF